MWTSWLFQTGLRKLFILGLVGTLAACGGGGGKKSDPAPASSTATSSSLSSPASSSLSSSSSLLGSSSSSLGSSSSSLGNAFSSSTSSAVVVPVDSTPDVFSFTTVVTASLNAAIPSNLVSVVGINVALPISIANGEYSINGGAFTSAAGTISNGQTLLVRTISAATIDSTTQAVVSVGGTAYSFSVSTINPQLGGAIQGAPLNISGVVTTIAGAPRGADAIGTAARFDSPRGAVIVGAYLYVADTGNATIRKVEVATGVVTTLAGSIYSRGFADGTGAAANFFNPRGIASDGTYLYVADSTNHKIRKIEIATGVVTTLAGSGSSGNADGTGAAAGFNNPQSITTDGAQLYVADTLNNKIRKIEIATGIVTTLAGSGSQGSADGTGAAASFSVPAGITTDGAHLYVADTSNNKIRKIEIATGIVTTLAGSGSQGAVDGTGAAARFYRPAGITTDGAHLYVSDTYNNKIRKIEIATGVVTTLTGSGSAGGVDGTGAAASFLEPEGIITDGTHLYVADAGNNKIRKIDKETVVVTTLAGSGRGADGTGAAASFLEPEGITTDGAQLYVADTENNKIRKIEIATSVVTTLAGGSWGDADGMGPAASFKNPKGITTDGTHLYVADTGNHKIRKIEIATGVVTTLAGSGSQGSADGTGAAARFRDPTGITVYQTHLYVVDKYNHKIRKIDIETGVVTTLAGGDSNGSADGTGAAASFSWPSGVTTDGSNLYVADEVNNKIRKINITTGVVTTLAGSGLLGDTDGIGAEVSFILPSGITSDGIYLYVGDSGNYNIRKIEIRTGVVTTLARAGGSGITTDGFSLYVTDSNNNTIRKIE